MDFSYKSLGLLRGNPYARKDNNLKLTDCSTPAPCLDTLTSATIAGTEVITQVVFNGVTYLPSQAVKTADGETIMDAPGTITAADVDDLKAWLEAIAKTVEFDVYFTVTHSSTTLTVTHVGEATLTSITTDAPETITGTRCCLLYDVFTNVITVAAGSITNITVDGETAALDTGTYADGNANAQLITDIQAELTALSVAYSSVTSVFASSAFTITIISTGRTILVDSAYADNTTSSEAFICP